MGGVIVKNLLEPLNLNDLHNWTEIMYAHVKRNASK